MLHLLQVLSVGTANGLLITYLASLPAVFAAGGTKHAALTSLGEMTVHDVMSHSSTVVQVQCEPSFCSMGPQHLAVGLNNQVHYYTHSCSPGQLVNRRSYLGGVQAVCLNDTFAAVLTGGRVLLHAIKDSSSGGQQGVGYGADMCLPQPGAARAEAITCMALSHHFLVTATASGTVCHHVVQDGALAAVNEHRYTGKPDSANQRRPQTCHEHNTGQHYKMLTQQACMSQTCTCLSSLATIFACPCWQVVLFNACLLNPLVPSLC